MIYLFLLNVFFFEFLAAVIITTHRTMATITMAAAADAPDT